ncbi:major facilitator superfamily domain-containing protein [Aspergillus egyptiacus]|nr:major facilitator superfamily domain-containing protein [Aspergillus egyptiacus]
MTDPAAEKAEREATPVSESPSPSLSPPASPVTEEGGLWGWLQVVGTFFVLFNIWGLAFAFGSFQSYYVLDFLPTVSASAISWIGTIQSWLLIIGGLVAGPLFDMGYYRPMFLVGSFLSVLGIMMTSLSHEYYQILLSQGICTGIGFGLLYIPSLTLVSRSFVRKRAMALGVSTAGAPLGGVIYTLVFEQLLPKVGFPWTVRIIGFMMLGLFVSAGFTLLFKGENTGQIPGARTRNLFDGRALKDLPFWNFTVANFFLYLGYMTPFYYMPIYAETKLHTSRSLGLYILIISQASSIVGRVITTAVAHYFGAMIPWIFCGVLSGVLCIAWISATSLARFILFSAFYGGISGALVPLPPSVFPHICPDPTALGAWLGMAQSITSFATLIGAPIAGALADLGASGSDDLNLVNVQLWCGILMVSGAVQLLGLWFLLWKFRDKKGLF